MKRYLCRWMIFLITASNVVIISAQSLTEDPVKILKKSDEACSRIESIEYEEEHFTGRAIHLTARVRQSRANVPMAGNVSGKYLVSGDLKHDEASPVGFSYSYDGKYLRILDLPGKQVQVVKAPTPYLVGSLVGSIGQIGFPQFSAENFFQEVIEKADQITYQGTKKIKGELCHIIGVTRTYNNPATGPQTSTFNWLIGVNDFLPRGFEGRGINRQIRILKVNEANSEIDPFVISTPDGFGEKIITGVEPKNKGLLTVGSDAPDWSLTDPSGKIHTSKDYLGKVVVIDFWGTWCVPCRKTMPGIQILSERFKHRETAVFGISVADEEGNPVEYMKQKGYTYGLLLKGDEVAAAFKAQVLPTLYVIGKDGKIIHAEFGHRANAVEELTKIIENALK